MYPVSIIDENNRVDIKLYVKKGIAKVKHKYKPFKLYPYIPEAQTPKLVTTKKIHAPNNAPQILNFIFFKKNGEIKPINKTLPHVQCVPL